MLRLHTGRDWSLFVMPNEVAAANNPVCQAETWSVTPDDLFSSHSPKGWLYSCTSGAGSFLVQTGGGLSFINHINDRQMMFLLLFYHICLSDCDLCASFRPGQSEAGLLLHRHLLSQQHLRVCVLLLPTRVTAPQLTSPPSNERSGKTKLSFLAHAHTKKKKKKERMHHKNKNKLWLVPFTNSAASIPVK